MYFLKLEELISAASQCRVSNSFSDFGNFQRYEESLPSFLSRVARRYVLPRVSILFIIPSRHRSAAFYCTRLGMRELNLVTAPVHVLPSCKAVSSIGRNRASREITLESRCAFCILRDIHVRGPCVAAISAVAP